MLQIFPIDTLITALQTIKTMYFVFSVYIILFGRSLSVFLSAREGYGADNLKYHHPACTG